jgi:hypothetical protein
MVLPKQPLGLRVFQGRVDLHLPIYEIRAITAPLFKTRFQRISILPCLFKPIVDSIIGPIRCRKIQIAPCVI